MSNDANRFDLNRTFADETPLRRYIRLTVGEGASILQLVWQELVLGLGTWVPGLPGIAMRHFLYPLLLQRFSRNSYLEKCVTVRCPSRIRLGENVIVDEFVQLTGSSRHDPAIVIGDRSFVRSFAVINAGPPTGYVHIGSNCSVGQGTILYGSGGLTIGNDVMIAGQCFIVASSHEHSDTNRPMNQQGFSAKGITIGNNVWIGAGAKILDGVAIGEGAIIGANAVVNRSVAAGEKVVGVPARPIPRQ